MSKPVAPFSISTDGALLEDGSEGLCLIVQGPAFELQVLVPDDEVPLLRCVPASRWETGAVRIGQSAGRSAFWACEDDEIWIGIGEDDQTSDFSVLVPESVFRDLLTQLETESGEGIC